MKTDKSLQEQRQEVENKIREAREEFWAARDVFEKKYDPLQKKLNKIIKEQTKDIEPNIQDLMNMKRGELTGAIYRKYYEWFCKEYDKKGVAWNGTGLGQLVVHISLYKNKPLEDQMGIKEIIPLINKGVNKDYPDQKYITISEHTCSEYGVWFTLINDDGSVELVCQRYGHPTVEKRFKDIDEALVYIQKRHYYSK